MVPSNSFVLLDPLDIIPSPGLVQDRFKRRVETGKYEPALTRNRFDPILLAHTFRQFRTEIEIDRAVGVLLQVLRARERAFLLVGVDHGSSRHFVDGNLPELFYRHLGWHTQAIGMLPKQPLAVLVLIENRAELPGSGFRRNLQVEVSDQLMPSAGTLLDLLVMLLEESRATVDHGNLVLPVVVNRGSQAASKRHLENYRFCCLRGPLQDRLGTVVRVEGLPLLDAESAHVAHVG